MAVRIGWDKFEVALLIGACNQVLNKKIAKPEIVSWLSAALLLLILKERTDENNYLTTSRLCNILWFVSFSRKKGDTHPKKKKRFRSPLQNAKTGV